MTLKPLARRPRAALVAATIAMALVPHPLALASVDVTRLGGRNRYETMAQICEDGFEQNG